MPTSCEFEFARATPIYYSGEQLSGSIRLVATKRLRLEAIDLSFVGVIQVAWTEKCHSTLIEHNDCAQTTLEQRYAGRQEYFRQSMNLAQKITLEPGIYAFNFGFTIPAHCPATCQHKYGGIVYALNLKLRRAKTFNKIFESRILVKNKLDLNEQLKLNQPHSVHTSGPASVVFSVPCTGYVPGQLIRYHLKFDELPHGSSVLVNLCQCISYKSLEPVTKTKVEVQVLTANETHKVKNPSKQVEEGILRVPLTAPISSPVHESLLYVSYYLKAVVMLGRNRIVQKLLLPITLGTIPLELQSVVGEGYGCHCYVNLAATLTAQDESVFNSSESMSSFDSSNSMNCSNNKLESEPKLQDYIYQSEPNCMLLY